LDGEGRGEGEFRRRGGEEMMFGWRRKGKREVKGRRMDGGGRTEGEFRRRGGEEGSRGGEKVLMEKKGENPGERRTDVGEETRFGWSRKG
jgi:hypothetical protein